MIIVNGKRTVPNPAWISKFFNLVCVIVMMVKVETVMINSNKRNKNYNNNIESEEDLFSKVQLYQKEKKRNETNKVVICTTDPCERRDPIDTANCRKTILSFSVLHSSLSLSLSFPFSLNSSPPSSS